jgi:hypothetical protein
MDKTICDEALELDEELEETTVGSVYESIETNLWLAEGYFSRGASGLAIECLRSAWCEYVRFRDVLCVYECSDSASVDQLGERLVRTLVNRAGDSAASLALGTAPESRPLWDALVAA